VAVALVVALTLVAFRLRKNSALLPDVVGDEIPMSLGEHASSFWRFAAPRSIEGILLVFITGFDIVLVGALADASTAATYTIANRYSALAIFGLQAMLLAIPTRISDLMHQGLVDQARHLYRVATWWTIGLCWPPAIALAIFAPVFMSVFGRDYRSGSTALVIMSFGVLATSVTGPSGVVLLMSGKSSANLVCTLVAIGLNVPLNLILIPRFGASGGAVAWTVSMIATNVMQMLYLWLMFRMHFFGREFLTVTGLCVGVFLGIGVATRLVLGTTVISLVVFGVISTVVYLGFLVRLRSRLHLDAFAVMMRGMAT
jgi:O-antigen/teichoic acid export membrane protein